MSARERAIEAASEMWDESDFAAMGVRDIKALWSRALLRFAAGEVEALAEEHFGETKQRPWTRESAVTGRKRYYDALMKRARALREAAGEEG